MLEGMMRYQFRILILVAVLALTTGAAFGQGGSATKPTSPPKTSPPKTQPKRTTTRTNTGRPSNTKPDKATAVEIAFWNSVKDSTNPNDFRAYLKKYPNGEFTEIAQNRINNLEAAKRNETKPTTSAPPARPTSRQAQTFTENINGVGLEMVEIPAGTFMMGSPASASKWEREDDEMPQHQVTLPSFYMGKYEVTQVQYRAVTGTNPSTFKGDTRPVENVSWYDAVEFCRKLSQMTGKEYRLPSEAEWEYACRAETTGTYAGNLDEMGWYVENSGRETHPVGQKQANGFGLYDMYGNVLEWCLDAYDSAWYSTSNNGAPRYSIAIDIYILRGGSWGDGSLVARSAKREKLPRNVTSTNGHTGFLGFRIVATSR